MSPSVVFFLLIARRMMVSGRMMRMVCVGVCGDCMMRMSVR